MGILAASLSSLWSVFVIVLTSARRARRLAAVDLPFAAVAALVALSASSICGAHRYPDQPLVRPVAVSGKLLSRLAQPPQFCVLAR